MIQVTKCTTFCGVAMALMKQKSNAVPKPSYYPVIKNILKPEHICSTLKTFREVFMLIIITIHNDLACYCNYQLSEM